MEKLSAELTDEGGDCKASNLRKNNNTTPPHLSLAAVPLRATFSTGGEKAGTPKFAWRQKRLLPWVEKLSAELTDEGDVG